MVTTYTDNKKDKENFFKKHNNDFDTYTSSLNEPDSYHKEYIFRDGAEWHEVTKPTYELKEVEIKMCKLSVEVKMLRTEFWSTETYSKFYYKKY